MKSKPFLSILLLALALAVFAAKAETPPAKGTVYFLVHSGACPCQRDACTAASPIAAQIQARLAPGYQYVTLDYGTRPEAVDPIMRAHKVFTFPALLVLDKNQNEVFKLQGKFNRLELLKKLGELGVITGDN